MSKKETPVFTNQHEEQHSFDSRQKALEALQETCRSLKICAACGTSAALYLAVMAAKGIKYDKQAFLALAEEVWDDLMRQEKDKPAN
jgi:hypothetical protein